MAIKCVSDFGRLTGSFCVVDGSLIETLACKGIKHNNMVASIMKKTTIVMTTLPGRL